jgi:hypothetical protein
MKSSAKSRNLRVQMICGSTTGGPTDMLDFVGYFLTLVYIAVSHFTFHNFFILYSTYVLESGGILCFCLCILGCTNYVDSHMIITIFIMFWLYFKFFLTDGFIFSAFNSRY